MNKKYRDHYLPLSISLISVFHHKTKQSKKISWLTFQKGNCGLILLQEDISQTPAMYQTTMQGDLRIKDTILYIGNVHNIVSNFNAEHSLS